MERHEDAVCALRALPLAACLDIDILDQSYPLLIITSVVHLLPRIGRFDRRFKAMVISCPMDVGTWIRHEREVLALELTL